MDAIVRKRQVSNTQQKIQSMKKRKLELEASLEAADALIGDEQQRLEKMQKELEELEDEKKEEGKVMEEEEEEEMVVVQDKGKGKGKELEMTEV